MKYYFAGKTSERLFSSLQFGWIFLFMGGNMIEGIVERRHTRFRRWFWAFFSGSIFLGGVGLSWTLADIVMIHFTSGITDDVLIEYVKPACQLWKLNGAEITQLILLPAGCVTFGSVRDNNRFFFVFQILLFSKQNNFILIMKDLKNGSTFLLMAWQTFPNPISMLTKSQTNYLKHP